jgi:hypothetical protein
VSKEFVTVPPLAFPKLVGLKLRKVWAPPEHHAPDSLRLTDGRNWLGAGCSDNGYTHFDRHGDNDPSDIIQALSKRFRVRFISDREPGFKEACDALEASDEAEEMADYRPVYFRLVIQDDKDRKHLIDWIVERYAAGKGLPSAAFEVVKADERAWDELLVAVVANKAADERLQKELKERHRAVAEQPPAPKKPGKRKGKGGA